MAIHIKAANKGKLHRKLGIPASEKIPASKIAAAKKSANPETRKEATFAQNAKHWNHSGRKLRPTMHGTRRSG